jgi:hypothetical protein
MSLHGYTFSLTGTLAGKFEFTNRENDLVSFYELLTEILEVADTVTEMPINNGSTEFYAQALAKHQGVEQKQKKLKNLESTLDISENELGKIQAFEEGRNLLASKKRISIREEIEMLCFSISHRKNSISRLAGCLFLTNIFDWFGLVKIMTYV